MPILDKDTISESIWEAAKEEIYAWLSECSYCDRPSAAVIDRMIENKYNELLEELLEGNTSA